MKDVEYMKAAARSLPLRQPSSVRFLPLCQTGSRRTADLQRTGCSSQTQTLLHSAAGNKDQKNIHTWEEEHLQRRWPWIWTHPPTKCGTGTLRLGTEMFSGSFSGEEIDVSVPQLGRIFLDCSSKRIGWQPSGRISNVHASVVCALCVSSAALVWLCWSVPARWLKHLWYNGLMDWKCWLLKKDV